MFDFNKNPISNSLEVTNSLEIKKVRFNKYVEVIYVDSYKKYNKEHSFDVVRTYQTLKTSTTFVDLFGFMMYYW